MNDTSRHKRPFRPPKAGFEDIKTIAFNINIGECVLAAEEIECLGYFVSIVDVGKLKDVSA